MRNEIYNEKFPIEAYFSGIMQLLEFIIKSFIQMEVIYLIKSEISGGTAAPN